MGVTLPSIDRALAEIDRALEGGGFRLPAGGPVADMGMFCWADKDIVFMGIKVSTYCCALVTEPGIGLCPEHRMDAIGSDEDLALRIKTWDEESPGWRWE